jgi:TRAP-type C4-dicarboxylate transport system substrate-binding protein
MRKNMAHKMRIIGYVLFLSLWTTIFTSPAVIRASDDTKPIKLKYGSYAPRGVIDEPVLWYLDEVSKKSGVKIKVETYFGGILAKPTDCLGALSNGVYQIGWISPALTPVSTPLAMIPNATPLVTPDLLSGLNASDELLRSFPAAKNEIQKLNLKFLFHTGTWHYELISTKPVRSLEDIKGLRVRTFGYLSKAWTELGGTPVAMPIPEIYDALQKGVIDAVLTQPISAYKSLRLCEVAKHFTRLDLGCLMTPVLIPNRTWDKFPEKVKNEMMSLAKDMPAKIDQMISQKELEAIDEMKKDGMTMYEIPDEDKDRIKDVAHRVANTLVKDLTDKGVKDAKAAMDFYLRSIEKFSSQ